MVVFKLFIWVHLENSKVALLLKDLKKLTKLQKSKKRIMFKLKSICVLFAFCFLACVSCQKEEVASSPVQQEECKTGTELVPNIENLQSENLRYSWYTYDEWPFTGIGYKDYYFSANALVIIIWNTGSSPFLATTTINGNRYASEDIPVGGSKTYTCTGGTYSSLTIQIAHVGTSSFSGIASVAYRY